MKIKEYNQMMAYLTRPKDSLKNIMKKSEFVKEQKKKNDTIRLPVTKYDTVDTIMILEMHWIKLLIMRTRL